MRIECDLQQFVEAEFADVPEPLWQGIEPLIPAERAKPRMGDLLLSYYDGRRGIAWKWSSLDASVKAPKGGTSPGRPEGSGDKRRKAHILTDARGVPIAALITGANVPDAS